MKPVKILFALFVVFFFPYTLRAQFKSLGMSERFGGYFEGTSKMCLLKNGKLAYVNVNFAQSINTQLFDQSYHRVAENNFVPAYKWPGKGRLLTVCEIDGNIIIVMVTVKDKIPVLYQVILDGNDASLKKEEVISSLAGLSDNDLFPKAPVKKKMADFVCCPDILSQHYAIASFSSDEKDPDKRISLSLFGKEQTLISRVFCSTNGSKYKTLSFSSVLIDENQDIYALANISDDDDKHKSVLLITVKKGAPSGTAKEIEIPEDCLPEGAVSIYQDNLKRFVLAFPKKANKKTAPLRYFIGLLDPRKAAFESIKETGVNEDATGKAQKLYGPKYEYNGHLKGIYTNSDGGFSVIYEEATYENSIHKFYIEYPQAYDIYVTIHDNAGEPKKSYLVPRRIMIPDPANSVRMALSPYHAHFCYFDYQSMNGKNYLFLNDSPKNENRLDSDLPPQEVSSLSALDAYYLLLEGDNVLPARKLLRDNTADELHATISPFDLTTYDAAKNCYIILNTDGKGVSTYYNLLWLKPE